MTNEKTTEYMDPAEQEAIEAAADELILVAITEEIVAMLDDLDADQLEEVRDYIGGMLS